MIDRPLLAITRRSLSEAGIRPSRFHGQNYVVDPELVRTIVESAEISVDETVLEIGPGVGTLTREIAGRARRVIAVEKDPASARYLRAKFSGSNVEVIQGDVLRLEIPETDKVISNLPYSISTPITFKLLYSKWFRFGVLTYQKEVAERLLSQPSDPEYSRLSVAVALLAEVRAVSDFPPESFYPAPRVSSTVVMLKRKTQAEDFDKGTLDATLKFLFSQRRRTLRKALETFSKISGGRRAEIDAKIRSEMLEKRVFELSPRDFIEISRAFAEQEGRGC
ncbi:MAG: ribosomal RNA small subunit methyltransferase A [Candidatus Methanosuratus sp.]|nr:ribosomal RNA small subunit methyltransferase A [Candidatus Methanosuratincola sp.]